MGYIEHLSGDPVMRRLIRVTGPVRIKRTRGACLFLCRSVVSQQISTQVARILEQRLMSLLPSNEFQPLHLLQVPEKSLRAIGLSAVKASYIHNVARYFEDLALDDNIHDKMDDESVIERLTQVKGIGRWTVEMLLMFSLGRKDVFPLDDYGILKSMEQYFSLTAASKSEMKKKIESLSISWSPYKTYAALHLWKARDLQ
ncbi:MAG: DNA-3-methyladenine glycosylase family protein [Bacteroidota bacterium]